MTRAQKRKHTEVSEDSNEETSKQTSPIKTRRTSVGGTAKPSTRDDTKKCFFCEEAGRNLKIINFKYDLVTHKCSDCTSYMDDMSGMFIA